MLTQWELSSKKSVHSQVKESMNSSKLSAQHSYKSISNKGRDKLNSLICSSVSLSIKNRIKMGMKILMGLMVLVADTVLVVVVDVIENKCEVILI